MPNPNYLFRNSVTGYGVRSPEFGYGVGTVTTFSEFIGSPIPKCFATALKFRVTFSGITPCANCFNYGSPVLYSYRNFGDPNGVYELCRYETSAQAPYWLLNTQVSGVYEEERLGSGCGGAINRYWDWLRLHISYSTAGMFLTLGTAPSELVSPVGSRHRYFQHNTGGGESGCGPFTLDNHLTVCTTSTLNNSATIGTGGTATVELL